MRRYYDVALNLEIDLNYIRFERYLNSAGGECVLRHLAKVVRPSPNNPDAYLLLRATFNFSAIDGNLSPLELMQEYGRDKIYFDLYYLVNDAAPILVRIQDEILELMKEAGVPVEQAQILASEVLSETDEAIDEDLKRFNLMHLDYDILEEASLHICEQLDNSSRYSFKPFLTGE